ncbi:peptide-methionine (S)-S-oxide reductase MsrA [Fulvivirga sp. 29W222]|uniref:Peptide methionine sulfoxide reductase MsrA n=1 Tax=Fulvivirga marina TaxID=2494733 RepID=A0A937KBI4_9BACT|nr:peptide-methionine (S)-S-oxide reductase MsrA [Fulvivirga marina]MBL6446207.1 peptide-methionine (S)-S-oxide reductase MsrA [Fulvivirga marina]
MNYLIKTPLIVFVLAAVVSCASGGDVKHDRQPIDPALAAKLDTAIFASGCFWCTEAVFERVKGVEDVVSGYSGGTKTNPTYEEVGEGRTDYAESVRVLFNPDVVTYEELVEMFFASHDPTQLNRQGPDIGKQYRSAIFYRTASQREIAKKVMAKLESSRKYDKPIVTEVTKFTSFYEAEDYHQNYYELHPNQPYVASVSRPKVEKFMKEYKNKLKDKYKD